MELFRLLGMIAIDNSKANDAIEETTDKASQSEGKLSNFFGKVGSFAVKAGKVMATGIAAGSTAIAGLSKAALDGYADYEQLVGGVKTLFGAGGKSLKEYAESVGKTTDEVSDEYYSMLKAQGTVLQDAKKAYVTAGMSANEYMETVTSFSASLIQSLNGDTETAAQKANQAITDMSDNANKMGTSMESIQNAYNGFAKQNYTMLDNLKLGYGGTKEEMARLLEDATKLSGVQYDLNSYADVVDAIHVIQDEMGITETTAEEASSTITGSVASMKSAWSNLVAGFGDEKANLSELINNFVDSASIALENILPRIEQILGGIGETITRITPIIVEKLPVIFEALLPGVISGAVSLITGLITALPSILQILIEQIPSIFTQIGKACVEVFPVLLATVQDLIGQIVEFVAEKFFGISIDSQSAFSEIGNLFTGLWELCTSIWESTGKPLFDALSSIFSNFEVDGSSVFSGIQSAFQLLWDAADEIWMSIGQPIFDLIIEAFQYVADNWDSISGTMSTLFQTLWDMCETAWTDIGQPIWDSISNIIGSVKDVFSEKMPEIMEFVQSCFDDISVIWNENLKPCFEAIGDFIENVLAPVFEGVFNGFIGPAVDTAFQFIKRLWEDTLKPVFTGICDFITGIFTLDFEKAFWGLVDVMRGIVNGIIGGAEFMVNGFVSALNGIIGGINALVSKAGDLLGFSWQIPTVPTVTLPKLARGGVLEQGQVGILEGSGAEAVVPLENNRKWISKVADDFEGALGSGSNQILNAILEELQFLNENLRGIIGDALDSTTFEINNREFARLVRAVN